MSLSQIYPFLVRTNQRLHKYVKAGIGRVVIALALQWVVLRKIAIIIVFHRVNDKTPGDLLSCSPDEFRKYCSFFKRHFNVVPLRSIVDKLHRHESFDCELAITFDDGYADNCEYAAPILKEMNLPATFFVTSRFIDTDMIAWWDKESHGVHKWMTWDQVRSLHSDGFDIGSHTCSHVDLAEVQPDMVSSEIVDSKKHIEAKLGTSIRLFAYPYGDHGHITEDAIDIIRKSGYRCCRGYGAINTAEQDPFHLYGIPWSPWYISPYQMIGDIVVRLLTRDIVRACQQILNFNRSY